MLFTSVALVFTPSARVAAASVASHHYGRFSLATQQPQPQPQPQPQDNNNGFNGAQKCCHQRLAVLLLLLVVVSPKLIALRRASPTETRNRHWLSSPQTNLYQAVAAIRYAGRYISRRSICLGSSNAAAAEYIWATLSTPRPEESQKEQREQRGATKRAPPLRPSINHHRREPSGATTLCASGCLSSCLQTTADPMLTARPLISALRSMRGLHYQPPT